MNEIILEIIEKVDKEIPEKLIGLVIRRLYYLGLTLTKDDEWELSFSIEKVVTSILNYCDIEEVPKGLYYVATERIVGDFLNIQKVKGNLDEVFNTVIEQAQKEVEVGDTRLVYYNRPDLTPGEQLTNLISAMSTYGEGDLLSFRTLQW